MRYISPMLPELYAMLIFRHIGMSLFATMPCHYALYLPAAAADATLSLLITLMLLMFDAAACHALMPLRFSP